MLNGEILDNSDDNTTSVAKLTTSVFLKERMFYTFNAPEDDTRRLTFNKGYWLSDVELTKGGIIATGYLWKLGRIIDTSS